MPLTRVRFFEGMLLTAEHLNAEQEYAREKHRRHNRHLHGVGIADGLQVTVTPDGSGLAVTVSPGLAIDPTGEELVVDEPIVVPITGPDDGCWFVSLRYAETESQPVAIATLADDLEADNLEATRIVEGVGASLARAIDPAAVTLARIIRDGSGWMCDPDFASARTR